MNLLKNRYLRAIPLVALLGLTIYYAQARWGQSQDAPKEYDTHGQVPGDPQNAVSDLGRIYQMMQTYERRNGLVYLVGGPGGEMVAESALRPSDKRGAGMLMTRTSTLQSDAEFAPSAYGFKNEKDVSDIFNNPDVRFDDALVTGEHWPTAGVYRAITTQGVFQRLDGTLMDSPKAPGTRDVLLYTDTYYHKNIRRANGTITMSPVGFYVVLWDDGQVEKIPHEKRLWALASSGNYEPAFPGQAGVPQGALTHDQYFNLQLLNLRRFKLS